MAAAEEKRVAPLELFFDLVFVFAITQVTALMSNHPTWTGLGQGMLVLSVLWWAWAAYAWLTNYVAAEEDRERLLMLAVMGAFLVAALATPEAFDEHALEFALAYAAARWLHIFIFAEANEDIDAGQAIRRLARTALPAPALLIVAGALDGEARTFFWILAIVIDWSTPLVFGNADFRLHPGHFAERHGLIVIIALGESIVAIGAGAGFDLATGEVIAAVLAIAAVAALWWAYFDIVALVAERRLVEAPDGEQAPLARDSYSYLHFPMIAGIVLLAVGLKKTELDVSEPLKTIPAIALCGGVALYLLGHIAFRLRNVGTLNKHRTLATVVVLALIPLTLEVDALIAVAAVTAVLIVLIAYEAIRFREARERVRANPEMSLAEMRGRPLKGRPLEGG